MQEVLYILLPLVILIISFQLLDGALAGFAWLGGKVVSALEDYFRS